MILSKYCFSKSVSGAVLPEVEGLDHAGRDRVILRFALDDLVVVVVVEDGGNGVVVIAVRSLVIHLNLLRDIEVPAVGAFTYGNDVT